MKQLSFTDGAYRTEPGKVGWFSRRFPPLGFHTRFTDIVLRAGFKAKWSTYDDRAWSESSWEVLRALEQVGVKFEITGIDNFRHLQAPCMFLGNHLSTLETTVLPCVIQPLKKVTFVVKQSLLEYPLFKHVMKSRDPIAVTQTNPRQDLKAMLTGGIERLGRGVSLIIFPEGERAGGFDPANFNSIGIKLAKRTDVPIVPLALDTEAWAMGNCVAEIGKIDPTRTVRFAFGNPLTVEGRGDDVHQAVVDFIGQKLRSWAAIDRG